MRGDFGPAAANSVARRLILPPHREGRQAQFIEAPVPRAGEAARLGTVLGRMRAGLGEDQPIAMLAVQAGMSLRSFQRRFRAAIGAAPGEWLAAERLRAARDLLEAAPATPLAVVARVCGFGSLEGVRHHFRRRLGVTPMGYRQRFSEY